jgi:hypothetical protein
MAQEISKETIPTVIRRVITNLEKAVTDYEKDEAIKDASATVDMFQAAKKANLHLEEELEKARRELIKAIDKVKIERVNKYDKAKKDGEVHNVGRSKKPKEEMSDASDISEKPKQKDLNIDRRRMEEDRKVAKFERKNPGTIERIIDKKPKKETVSKNISSKVVRFAEKNKNKKPEEIEEILSKERKFPDEETLRYREDMKKKYEQRQEHKTIHMIVREFEQTTIAGLDKAMFAIQRITEIVRANKSIVLDPSYISTLNKWRHFLHELHKVYPFENTYDNTANEKPGIILELKANAE